MSRPAPRIARPHRIAPQRAVERPRAAPRQAVRQQQRIERQQMRAQHPDRPQNRAQQLDRTQQPKQLRAQQIQENRRELQNLRNRQRQGLQAKGLTPQDRQKLRVEQRQQMQDLRAQQRERAQNNRRDNNQQASDRQSDRQQANEPARLNAAAIGPRAQQRAATRQQREEQRAQRIQQRLQAREQRAGNRQNLVGQRITREQARDGRFAARFFNRADQRDARLTRLFARQAWRHGHRAAFVAWLGPVFYPYLYSDFFDYTFFPYAYDDGYWAYAYDDFIDGVFFAYGSPYASDPGASPLAQMGPPVTTGSTSHASIESNPRMRRSVEQVCNPAGALTAWPFRQIEATVRPTADQQKLFDDLKGAATEAADTFKSSCRTDFTMTPTGRLDATISRLEASLDALAIVRPPLEAFYNSLSDEQRARFNEIGPDIGQAQARAAARSGQQTAEANACAGDKAGLINLPIQTLRDRLKPNDEQSTLLDKLETSTGAAVDALQAACPDGVPLTPTARLEAFEKRLTAMLDAAETVKPALDEFYASLTNEQKAQFNTLGRVAQQPN